MKFAYTIIYVENVSETIEFYENAFGFTKKFVTPEGDYGELISGETTLSFASNELGKSNFESGFTTLSSLTKPAGVELAFTSANIEEDFQRAVDGGAKEYVPLKEKPWGQKVGCLR
ncbi:MAG: VOC family protein [Flavobacteriales bacterium]|nr:VOC family protein [Flavobacteriales bacterium]